MERAFSLGLRDSVERVRRGMDGRAENHRAHWGDPRPLGMEGGERRKHLSCLEAHDLGTGSALKTGLTPSVSTATL